MIPVVLYWSVNTEHLYSTNSCTNSWYPLGDVSVSLLTLSWDFFHVLDLWCGGTSAAHMGHAIPSAGMGCTGGKTTYGSMGETHTLLLERPGGGDALGKLGEIREHCGAKGSRTQIHRQSGNLVSSAVCGIVCFIKISTRSGISFFTLAQTFQSRRATWVYTHYDLEMHLSGFA